MAKGEIFPSQLQWNKSTNIKQRKKQNDRKMNVNSSVPPWLCSRAAQPCWFLCYRMQHGYILVFLHLCSKHWNSQEHKGAYYYPDNKIPAAQMQQAPGTQDFFTSTTYLRAVIIGRFSPVRQVWVKGGTKKGRISKAKRLISDHMCSYTCEPLLVLWGPKQGQQRSVTFACEMLSA